MTRARARARASRANPNPNPNPKPKPKPKPTLTLTGTSLERLAKLKTVFKPNGSVTAASSSQVSDGAAAVLLMSRARARQLGLRPLGALRSYRVVGCKPDEMGIGPAVAIPAG